MKNLRDLLQGLDIERVTISILYFGNYDAIFLGKGLNSRYTNPLQPSSSILGKIESLNPWFKEEATRKEVLH